MGKNNGKHRKKTEFQKWESIMAKLDYAMKKQASNLKKSKKEKEDE